MPADAGGQPHLAVDLRHQAGSLALDVRFATAAPWTVLFGASGSGKSTVLRAIAGLVRPRTGRILVEQEVVADSGAGVWLPAHRRPVRWAGQQTALFPHRSVRRNLEMGVVAGDAATAAQALAHFGLEPLAERTPGELSGGQQQRVAVVRAALGARGRLLLLDEPFSGLDAGVRTELIGQMRAWLGGSPVLSVTHDVGEAFELGSEVVRLRGGRVAAQGTVAEVLGEERARLRGVLGVE